MVQVYNDRELKIAILDGILFEGCQYYVDISLFSRGVIDKWIEEEQIEKFVDYHPRNSILKLRFDIVVGYVNILGSYYDVRSKKLLDGVSGKLQFKTLLDDIIDISSKLTFSFKGTSFGRRVSTSQYDDNDIEQLDYFYQLAFSYPSNSNLKALLNQCISHPNLTSKTNPVLVNSNKSKFVPNYYYSRISQISTFIEVDDSVALSNSVLVCKTYKRCGKRLFPHKILNLVNEQSNDTVENRFLLFFLKEVNTICIKLSSSKTDVVVKRKAITLQKFVSFYLQNPFFKAISQLTFLPDSSSVLLRKSGYREIYFHYIQSKQSFRPIIEEQKRILHNARLKNVATLYEIWVFFKIASLLFEKGTIIENLGGRRLENGSFIDTLTWQLDYIKLHYNKSFSRKSGDSYSVRLRPDVTLELNNHFVLFDAKYKFNDVSDGEEQLLRLVKQEDIHKMHTYIDAISKVKSALVVYPGTEFIFYDKSGVIHNDVSDILSLNGVGAVTAQPNHTNSNLELLLASLKRKDA